MRQYRRLPPLSSRGGARLRRTEGSLALALFPVCPATLWSVMHAHQGKKLSRRMIEELEHDKRSSPELRRARLLPEKVQPTHRHRDLIDHIGPTGDALALERSTQAAGPPRVRCGRYRAEHLRVERDLLIEVAESQGGQVHRLAVFDAAIDEAGRRRASLAELLPFHKPYVAAVDDHERELREIGHRVEPALRQEDAPRCDASSRRATAAAVRSRHRPYPDRDRTDDPIFLGAARRQRHPHQR